MKSLLACSLCLPILGQILTRGSLRIMVKNVDPNYDAYRRQKSSIKSCFGHKYVYVCEVQCQIVALRSIFCPLLRRPRFSGWHRAFDELSFGEFAQENSAFFGAKKLRKWSHDIWSYLDLLRSCIKQSVHAIHYLKDKNTVNKMQ